MAAPKFLAQVISYKLLSVTLKFVFLKFKEKPHTNKINQGLIVDQGTEVTTLPVDFTQTSQSLLFKAKDFFQRNPPPNK